MHIKHLDTGTGSARSAKDYLLQDHDHKGEVRSSVQVLRGNPEFVTQLADSLDFKHKYTSAVLAWHKDDKPTPEQINEAVSEYERVAFAGLNHDQYASYAVMHDNDHVHIVTARVELSTRKSLNIAPPGHEKTYDLVRDKLNEKYGWAKPNDLTRKRLVNDSLNIHAEVKANEAKKMVNDTVTELVNAGKLADRTDVRTYLAQFGEITREGKDYISLKPKGFKKAFKLKGAVYEREFKLDGFIKEVEREQGERATRGQADRDREVARIEQVIEQVVKDRAGYNRGRYDQKAQSTTRENDRSKAEHHQGRKDHAQELTGEQERNRERSRDLSTDVKQSETALLDSSSNRGRVSDRRTHDQHLRSRELDNKPVPRPTNGKRRDSESRRDQEESQSLHSDKQSLHKRDRGQEELQDQRMARQRQRLMVRRDQEEREINDRVRERVKANIESTRKAVQERTTQDNTAVRRELERHQEQLRSDHSRSADHYRGTERGVKVIRESKSEHKDTLRRSASDSLSRASDSLSETLGRTGRARQRLGTAVKQCLSKAVEKIKEIAHKAQQQSQSWGMSR